MDAIFYILIFVAVAVVIYFGVNALLKDKTSVLQRAENLKNNGDYDAAAEIYNSLILKDQFNPVYHCLLADVYYETDNFKRAIVEYEIALKNEKELGLDEIRRLNRNLGIAYYKINNYPKAFLSLFNAYLNNQTDATVCTYIGLVYASQKKYEKAYNYLSKAAGLDPRSFEVHYYTGIIAALLTKRDVAIREFSIAKRFNPNNPYIDLYIGAILKDNRDYMTAIKYLKNAQKSINDIEFKMKTSLLTVECYKGIGLIEDAITTLETARQENTDPNNPKAVEWKKNVMYNLGMAYVKKGYMEKGLAAWNDLKHFDFFYRDIKELTSSETSRESLAHATERWMVMPGVTMQDILPVKDIVSNKLFDIDTLEKTVEQNLGGVQAEAISVVETFKNMPVRQFKETSRKLMSFMGFSISKEITINYDSDFADGKAVGYVARKDRQDYLVIIKRYNDNVSGVVLMNAIGTAKTMGIPNAVVMITSKYNPDALNIAKKNRNLVLIDRRGLVKALKATIKTGG